MDPHADLPASRRVRWLARFALLWAVIILVRLIDLQVIRQKKHREDALNQQMHLKEVQASRGAIFDRNGRVMAMSVPVETVTVNPKLLPDRPVAAHMLAEILGLDEKQLLDRLETYAAARKGYMVVARRVDAERAGRLRTLGVDWIGFEQEGLRKYPNGPLAAHLLGSVNHKEEGDAGVELQFEDELGGYPGFEWITTDVKNRSFDSAVQTAPQSGRNLVLTIDRRIQFTADTELKKAVIQNKCSSGTAVVMNPHTGEILAMSNYPTYDPNEAPKSKDDYSTRKNLAVADPFEPGSIFKVFTIAAALENGITPEMRFFCHHGRLSVNGRTIHEAKGGYGDLTVEEILAKSSNIGAFKIGSRIGEAKLHEYLMRFGFNQPTGVELPSESSGLVFRLSKWQPTSLGSVAMGHEVLTTSVQLARACSAIANNGLLVRPHLTMQKAPAGAEIQLVAYQPPDEQPVRILKPETAITMRRMMETVVLKGTGTSARLDGYTCGGKTGTAQMYDKTTHRYTHFYNASFMGFAPLSNPAVVVVVTLNGSSKYGGVIAGPVFKEIAQTALRALNVPQDNVDPSTLDDAVESAPVADVADAGMTNSEAEELHRELETEQANQKSAIPLGPTVPSFLGKPIRTVVEEASAQGVRVDLDGDGIAREQDPPPGTRLMAGQKVKVRFER